MLALFHIQLQQDQVLEALRNHRGPGHAFRGRCAPAVVVQAQTVRAAFTVAYDLGRASIGVQEGQRIEQV